MTVAPVTVALVATTTTFNIMRFDVMDPKHCIITRGQTGCDMVDVTFYVGNQWNIMVNAVHNFVINKILVDTDHSLLILFHALCAMFFNCSANFVTSSFGFFPSGVATADFQSPVAPIFCILLLHFNLSHVLFHHIHKPPFWPSRFLCSGNSILSILLPMYQFFSQFCYWQLKISI